MGIRSNWHVLLVIIFIVIASMRIAATYGVFNHTHDEHQHIAAGMQWLDKGTYTYDMLGTPLPRIAVALGPYLDGIRSFGYPNRWDEGHAILYSNDAYFHNLSLARLGVLPFFMFASILVWIWCRMIFDDVTALVATGLFTTLPTVLAHSGLATTDIALTAFYVAFLVVFTHWLERPTLLRSLLVGLTAALAILSKLSALLFLPTAAVALFLSFWFGGRSNYKQLYRFFRDYTVQICFSAIVAAVVIWAVYGFSIGSISDYTRFPPPYLVIDDVLGKQGVLHDAAYSVLELRIPAPEFFNGISELLTGSFHGRNSYLFGEIRHKGGYWNFFPVALGVKTPLPFLFLTLIGLVVTLFKNNVSRNFRQLAPVVTTVSLLAVTMLSSINIGVRHILPIYPLMAMIAGYGAVVLCTQNVMRMFGYASVGGLLIWQVISSVGAHPDYLVYFNELANDEPEKVLLASDFDWGQDIQRLSDALKERSIDKVSVCLRGPKKHLRWNTNFDVQWLKAYEFTPGWIAISRACLYQSGKKPPFNRYDWLKAYEPVDKIGQTISLYHIPEKR